MCALTFARRYLYNTSDHPRDGASAVADQMRRIYGVRTTSKRRLPKSKGCGVTRSSGMLFSFSEYTSLNELSKGMSNDYHVPAEEGATIVRVDTAFGGVRHA